MKPNWPIISIGITGIMFWTSVYYNGFFLSLIILIIVAAILGLWLRLTGRA